MKIYFAQARAIHGCRDAKYLIICVYLYATDASSLHQLAANRQWHIPACFETQTLSLGVQQHCWTEKAKFVSRKHLEVGGGRGTIGSKYPETCKENKTTCSFTMAHAYINSTADL